MEKKVYEFYGSVMLFGKEVRRNWRAQTIAISEKQAINNLLFQARKLLKLGPRTKLELSARPKPVRTI